MAKKIQIKMLLVVMLVVKLSSFATAQNKESLSLIDCEDPSQWIGKVVLNKEIKRNGKFSFETFGKYRVETFYKTFIPIDPNSTYILTGYMRSLDHKNPASGYMGLAMYDKTRELITMESVGAFSGTESELVLPVNKNATEIVIKKNMKYLEYQDRTFVFKLAFHIKDNYADLPNFNLSPRVKEIIQDGDKLKVILYSPLEKAYEIGTKIRLHSAFNNPFYWAAEGWMPDQWKMFSITLKGVSDYGIPNDKFWKGTKYVRPFFWFGNWNRIPKEGAKLLIDDISFKKTKQD